LFAHESTDYKLSYKKAQKEPKSGASLVSFCAFLWLLLRQHVDRADARASHRQEGLA
jgi:hypothetical protein